MTDRISKILPIAIDDAEVLKKVAKEIPLSDIASDFIQQLIVDMFATMRHAPGIGLAAPQIFESIRLIVFYLPAARDELGIGVPDTVLINPIIEKLDDEIDLQYEGCLSIPGLRGKVERFKKIKYSGYNQYGEYFERVAEGWHARLVQHEVDHLNGIVYPELMREEDSLITFDEWKALTAISS